MMKRKGAWLAAGLGFVWLAFVYASFYLVQQQRPFDAERIQYARTVLQTFWLSGRGPVEGANVGAIGSTLLDLMVGGAIWLIGAALGRRLCRWLGVQFGDAGEGLVLSSGVGLGALSLSVLGLGLLGWLRSPMMALLLAGAAVLLLPDLVAVGRAATGLRPKDRPNGLASFYLATVLLMVVLVALTPPIDWDGLFYHLTMPQRYLEQGRIAPVTDVPQQHFPGLMEMLYLLAMALKGDVTAKLLHLAYGLGLGGMVYLLARRHVGPAYGWRAVLLYAGTPMVAILGGWAYNDLALAFYQIAALYALFNWIETPRRAWLALSGILCGFALGLKYTAFVCPLALSLLLAWHLLRTRAPSREWLYSGGLLAGSTVVTAAPWYLRNWALTGNPVYPFAYSFFDGAGWDAWRAAWYARAGSGLGWDLWELVKLPWTLTLGLRDMNFYDGRVGPLFLLALPFGLAWVLGLYGRPRCRPRAVSYLLFFAAAQYAAWMLGVVTSGALFQSRLLLPACVALCAPMAYLFEELRVLDMPSFSLQRMIGMSVVLVLAANLCYQALDLIRIYPLGVLSGAETRQAFLGRNLGAYYAAMQLVNEQVSEDGRALFLWEPRSYYCERPAQPDPILERWAWLRHLHGGDLDAIERTLRDEGYTHVLLYRSGLEFMRRARFDPLGDSEASSLDAFLSAYLEEEATVGEAYVLYRIGRKGSQ
jgi:hypothetical protein